VSKTIFFASKTFFIASKSLVMNCQSFTHKNLRLLKQIFATPGVLVLWIQLVHVITMLDKSPSDPNPFAGSHSGNSVHLLHSLFHIDHLFYTGTIVTRYLFCQAKSGER
jgi:hypothetical protein